MWICKNLEDSIPTSSEVPFMANLYHGQNYMFYLKTKSFLNVPRIFRHLFVFTVPVCCGTNIGGRIGIRKHLNIHNFLALFTFVFYSLEFPSLLFLCRFPCSCWYAPPIMWQLSFPIVCIFLGQKLRKHVKTYSSVMKKKIYGTEELSAKYHRSRK